MKNSALSWLKLFLWTVCAFHIGVGLALNLDLGLKEWVAATLYSARVDWSDTQFVYILRPLGAFMFALGVMAAFAARDPIANRAIALGFVLLFAIRGLQRILFISDIESAFGISAGRSIAQMIVMWTLAASLALLLRAAASARDTATARA